MESESCIITTKNRFINQSSSLHFEQKISLNGHCDGLPPRSNNNSQVSQNGANEHKRWSTSYSQKTDISDNSTSQPYNQDDCSSKDSKLPSYVGISCTISGYSSYSRYCSSIRGSISRGSSPIMRNYEVIDGPNIVQHHHTHNHHFHHQTHHNNNHSHLDSSHHQQNQRQTLISAISPNNWPREENGIISNHTHRNNDLNCEDSEYDVDTSESSEKSLVQRRIESLYGSNVAEVWRDSRSKVKKVNKKKIDMINHRSPSCPPHALKSKECKKSPAVFSHLNEKFLSKIDADPKEPVNGLISRLNEVLNVNRTKQNGIQSTKENGFHISDTIGHYHHNHNGETAHGNGFERHLSDDCMGEDQVDKVNIKEDNHYEEKQVIKHGEMYLIKLEETIKEIKAQVNKTEKILQEESHLMSEEIIGNLLSSIGKGKLLITQKLKQFRELCHKNINGNSSEQFSTKNEDLDGFWEMVYIQVEDVLNGFEEIYKLKQNNWIVNESAKITQPKIRSPKKISSKASPKQQKNTARDEMRKQRLREAKLKNQSRIQEKKDDEDIVIFVPSNDNMLINNGQKNVS